MQCSAGGFLCFEKRMRKDAARSKARGVSPGVGNDNAQHRRGERKPLKSLLISITLLAAGVIATFASPSTSPQLASIERKLNHLESNARLARPDQRPTILTENEINAYIASDQITLPDGVESVTLQGEPGVITGHARVDFDRVRAGIHSSNPLLAVFTGIHDVEVITHAHGIGHQGYVHVDSVSLDGIEVPRFALELFVEKYIQPRVPGVGMDSVFVLPDKIDMAVVGHHTLTLTQK